MHNQYALKLFAHKKETRWNISPLVSSPRPFLLLKRITALVAENFFPIKLALEELRHLLEGAHHPVMIYIDHKNLLYLQTAYPLIPCKACWFLFFSRFDFCLHYHSADKSVKADPSSWSFDPEDQGTELQFIMEPSSIIPVAQTLLKYIWSLLSANMFVLHSPVTYLACIFDLVYLSDSCLNLRQPNVFNWTPPALTHVLFDHYSYLPLWYRVLLSTTHQCVSHC